MPNWCETNYTLTGERKALESVYELMRNLEDREKPEIENDFGATWLGCLVHALGHDWQNISCRGSWTNLSLKGDTLTFTTWSAWTPPTDVVDLIQQKFPEIDYFYYAEEPGNCLYETNDIEGKYYPFRYLLEYTRDEEWYMGQYTTSESLLKAINQQTGKHFRNINEAKHYSDTLRHSSDVDDYFVIHKIDLC